MHRRHLIYPVDPVTIEGNLNSVNTNSIRGIGSAQAYTLKDNNHCKREARSNYNTKNDPDDSSMTLFCKYSSEE
jgi:hypothetical protein